MLFIVDYDKSSLKTDDINKYPDIKQAFIQEYKSIMGKEPYFSEDGIFQFPSDYEYRYEAYEITKDNIRANQELASLIQKYSKYFYESVIEISDAAKYYVPLEFDMLFSDGAVDIRDLC